MNPADFFRQIPAMTVDQVKDLIKEKNLGEYNLIDVRQPGEYEQSHIPGAKLIPLGELAARKGELDQCKPTILY
jgi:sulfur-carrier protein adenylyltransferase/sulfurtransferase